MLLASANQCSRILRLFLFSFGSAFCGHHKRLPVNGGANQHPECFWLRPISAHEPSAFAVYSGLALGNVLEASAAAAKSFQSCPTLCDPIDSSLPGSPVPRILQARTLEWFAITFSNAWKWKVKVKSLRRVRLLATPWTAAYQAPPSMEFSRQEYWSGVPLLVLEMSGALWGRESRPSFGLWHRTVEALITKRDWEEWMLGTRPQA